MFGLGPTELLLILVIVMIIFGAGKLPQVFGALGKGVKEFRDASEGRAQQAETNLSYEAGSANSNVNSGDTTISPLPTAPRTTRQYK